MFRRNSNFRETDEESISSMSVGIPQYISAPAHNLPDQTVATEKDYEEETVAEIDEFVNEFDVSKEKPRDLDEKLRRRRFLGFMWILICIFVLMMVGAIITFGYKHEVVYSSQRSSLPIEGKPVLKFREDKGEHTFKIVQLADLHIGETKEKDAKTFGVIDKIMQIEQPDLIVLSGDQISANYSRNKAAEAYTDLGEELSKHNTPWAMIFGTADDTDYEDPTTHEHYPPFYKRERLLDIDQRFPLSLTQRGPPTIFGITNYILDVTIDGQTAANLFFYDTGGGSLPQQLSQNQVNWFYHSYQRHPAMAFQYYPPSELHHSDKCIGYFGEEFKPLHNDPGIVNAMSETSRVYLLAVGKNHGNDYCCPFTQDLQVCFARHTGYGGYGDWERGMRVYELTIADPSTRTMDWKSWVRLESGKVISEVSRDSMLSTF